MTQIKKHRIRLNQSISENHLQINIDPKIANEDTIEKKDTLN